MTEKLKAAFRNPGKDYRSAPFWSWNGRMEAAEVRRQVRDMKAHGMGGFFMHSRVGLETPYMGREWMQCIRAAVDEAAKIGMNAWLYDEDRWPSGFAGGAVPARGEAGRQKRLVMRIHRKGFKPTGRELCVFAVKVDEKQGARRLISQRALSGAANRKRGEMLLSFTQETCPPRPWHNGYPYSDNLSAESVRWFLESTYVPYVEALKEHIPRVVPGMFTDEPNASAPAATTPEARTISWTPVFADEFRKRRGYDILSVLPAFFFDDARSLTVRHDYWKTIAELFATNYSRQLGEFCRKHHLALTGHYNQESSMLTQMREAGAVMPNYVWQDAPGIDILTEQREEYLTAKQCTSVASQFGRKTVLSELYGCTGWEFTFEGMKWVGDWQYALGVTLRCPHLTLYTLRGCAKRDYPPSFNYNNTWWKYNKVHEDYFARLGLMLTQGEPVRDILLVHPIASAWAAYDGERADRVKPWDRGLTSTMRTLLSHHRDFDLGDEMILAEHARVTKKGFKVGKMTYKVVVLPPMLTISASTAKLLAEFLAAGARIVAIRPLPELVDALPTKLLEPVWKHANTQVIASAAELADALDRAVPPTVRVRDHAGQEIEPMLYQLRRTGRKRVLFLCNTDRDTPCDAEVVLSEKGTIEEWDPLTGNTRAVPAFKAEGGITWRASLGPAGSRLYVIDTAGTPATAKAQDTRLDPSIYPVWEFWYDEMLRGERKKIGGCLLGPTWRFRRTDPNVLTLDRCRWRLKRGKLSKPMPVWQAQLAVRKKLGLRPVHNNGDIQRWLWVDDPKDIGRAPTEYHFAFRVDAVPRGKVFLVLEGSEHFRIRLNGKNVPVQKSGWYLDRCMHRIGLPRLKRGKNRLVLSCDTVDTMQVEDCFLIGDFGVEVSTRAVTVEPETLHAGDWTLQGYMHYPGGMIYEATFTAPRGAKNAILHLGRFSATVVAVRVNGKAAGFIPWRSADGLDLRKHLKTGANRIEIEVMGSPRNMLGPLHNAHGKTAWTGAGQFLTTGDEYTPDYVLWPWGLMEQVRITFYG